MRIDDPALVVNALARVLGPLFEVPGTPLIQTICLHVKSQRVLVLLDGSEHCVNRLRAPGECLASRGSEHSDHRDQREPVAHRGEQTVTCHRSRCR
jgi:predicted ATPase